GKLLRSLIAEDIAACAAHDQGRGADLSNLASELFAPGVRSRVIFRASPLVVLERPLSARELPQVVKETAPQHLGVSKRIELGSPFQKCLGRIKLGGAGKFPDSFGAGRVDLGANIYDHQALNPFAVTDGAGDRIEREFSDDYIRQFTTQMSPEEC